jgi:GAF domain-containing protein
VRNPPACCRSRIADDAILPARNVVLLGALASLAAAAIVNARLFEQSERVIVELAMAHSTVTRHAEVLEAVAVVHERLTQLALDGADLQQVALDTAEWSGCEIWIEDAAGRELAASRPRDETDATQSVSETTGSGRSRSRMFPIVAGGVVSERCLSRIRRNSMPYVRRRWSAQARL